MRFMSRRTRSDIIADYMVDNNGEANPFTLAGERNWDYQRTINDLEKLSREGLCRRGDDGVYRSVAPGKPKGGKERVVNYFFVKGPDYAAKRGEIIEKLGFTDSEINLAIMDGFLTMRKGGGYSLSPQVWVERGIRVVPEDDSQQDGVVHRRNSARAKQVSPKENSEYIRLFNTYLAKQLEKNGTEHSISVGELVRAIGLPKFKRLKTDGILRADGQGTCKFTQEAVKRRIEGLEF